MFPCSSPKNYNQDILVKNNSHRLDSRYILIWLGKIYLQGKVKMKKDRYLEKWSKHLINANILWISRRKIKMLCLKPAYVLHMTTLFSLASVYTLLLLNQHGGKETEIGRWTLKWIHIYQGTGMKDAAIRYAILMLLKSWITQHYEWFMTCNQWNLHRTLNHYHSFNCADAELIWGQIICIQVHFHPFPQPKISSNSKKIEQFGNYSITYAQHQSFMRHLKYFTM